MTRPARTILYVIAIVVLGITVGVRLRPPDLARVDAAYLGFRGVERALRRLRTRARNKAGLVIVVGDSSVMRRHLRQEECFAHVFKARALRRRMEGKFLAFPALSSDGYYLIADELASLEPRAVVLVANLQSFSEVWIKTPNFKRPYLAGWLRPGRVVEAMLLPLEQLGVQGMEILTFPVIRWAGLGGVFDVLHLYRTGFRSSPLGRGFSRASTAHGLAELYPDHLSEEHAGVRVLAAAVRRLVTAGIPTLVLMQPVHVGYLQKVGEYRRKGIRDGIATLKSEILRNGGCVLDLTHALREAEFVDKSTHFGPSGARAVATATFAAVRAMVEGRAPRATETLPARGGERVSPAVDTPVRWNCGGRFCCFDAAAVGTAAAG